LASSSILANSKIPLKTQKAEIAEQCSCFQAYLTRKTALCRLQAGATWQINEQTASWELSGATGALLGKLLNQMMNAVSAHSEALPSAT